MQYISKSRFKPKALEIMRSVQQTGQPIVITDHGRPVLELRPFQAEATHEDPATYLKGSVIDYVEPSEPVEDDWDAA